MPGQRIGNEKSAQVIELYKQGMRVVDIAEKLGIHHHSVRTRIAKYEAMLKEKIEEKQKEEVEDIISQMKGDKPKSIVKKILNVLDVEENIVAEYLDKGFDPLNRVLGTIMDKAIKLYEIDQQRQMYDEMENSQDNFYDAMANAIEKLVNVEDFIDEDSLNKDEDE